MKIVKIDTEDNIYNIELEYNNDIINSLNSIDNNNLELLYEWNFETNIVECYGCIDSDCNIKNKHILPSFGIPSSNIICDKSEECNIYGNIYIVCKNKDYFDYDYGMLYFNINDNDNNVDNNDDNDDNNDDNDDNKNDNDNDDNNLVNNHNTKLFKSKYLVENNIENDLLDYDNNIY